MMDVGPQPKLGLLLSLTVMNIVAIGICIYAPSPKEAESSFDGKKAVRVRVKRRSEHSLERGVGIKTNTVGDEITESEEDLKRITTEKNNLEGAVEQVYAEEDFLKEKSEIYRADVTHLLRNIDNGKIATAADLDGNASYISTEEDCPKEKSEVNSDIAKHNLKDAGVDQTTRTTEPNLDFSVKHISAEETNRPKEQTEIRVVVAKRPTAEDFELEVGTNPTILEKNRNNFNVITINKNFDNDSSKEGSDVSLNDICGYDAEMRCLPQDLGTSVTGVLKKSYQLMNTFSTKVIPVVENVNEQIAKTAHIERDMDSRVLGVINASVCPAVIRMSDSIKRINEKINRVTENIHLTKKCSVSCQVSESLLVKSVPRKNSFFITASPLSESRILNLLGHISCRMVTRRKGRSSFKKPVSKYWANRKKTLMKKFNVRCKENQQHLNACDTSAHKESTVFESYSTISDVDQLDQPLRYFEKGKVQEETKTNESSACVNLCNNVESRAGIGENSAEGKMNLSEITNDRSIIASSSHLIGGETVPSLPIHLPPYLSSYDEFGRRRSSEALPTFPEPQFDNENQESSGCMNGAVTGAQISSLAVAAEFSNEKDLRLATNQDNLVEECDVKSLELSSRVRNTVRRMRGPLNNQPGLQDILDMLDPNAERNTVENLFLLILKIFDTWSESQLSVVPSRAVSHFSSPSESTCISFPVRHKSIAPFEEIVESENEMCDPINFYSCVNTAFSCEDKESGVFKDEEETANRAVVSIFEESRTPEYTEIKESMASALQGTSSGAFTYNFDREPKALLYKEQYGIACKIAAECIENALSTAVPGNDHIFCPSDTEKIAKEKQKSSLVASRASSEESFHSWSADSTPGSSEDYSYHECDTSLGLLLSENPLERGNSNKHNLSERSLTREQEKLAWCQEEKVSRSDAHCSTAYYISRQSGTAMILKAPSIESWMLNSTSGDGVEIRNSHSELKSEEMSDLSSRPISFTTDDMSDVESDRSFTSESSKDFQIRGQRSSKLFSWLKTKRPKTPNTTVTGEAPSRAQSDCCLKVAESYVINRNASLSDEN